MVIQKNWLLKLLDDFLGDFPAPRVQDIQKHFLLAAVMPIKTALGYRSALADSVHRRLGESVVPERPVRSHSNGLPLVGSSLPLSLRFSHTFHPGWRDTRPTSRSSQHKQPRNKLNI